MAVVPPGFAELRGRGTFEAKEHLKRLLGAQWDADNKRWLVPAHFYRRARELMDQALLGTLEPLDVQVQPKMPVGRLMCWECGKEKPLYEFSKKGALDQYYCGCIEV